MKKNILICRDYDLDFVDLLKKGNFEFQEKNEVVYINDEFLEFVSMDLILNGESEYYQNLKFDDVIKIVDETTRTKKFLANYIYANYYIQ